MWHKPKEAKMRDIYSELVNIARPPTASGSIYTGSRVLSKKLFQNITTLFGVLYFRRGKKINVFFIERKSR